MTRLALVAAPLLLSGCFFYDSTWGARKTAQQHNAVLATPAALPVSSATAPISQRVLRVRVYATPTYAAQTVDWERHVHGLIDDANATLARTIDARLVVDESASWEAATQDKLEPTLRALAAKDKGDDAELVIAFIGGQPTATRSFHDLGMAENPGKRVVLRAPSVADDYDAVEKSFDELSEEARTRLRKQRRRHREVAVLLHEVGHALGAAHDDDPRSLMHPSYDPKMEELGAAAIAAIKAHLAAPPPPTAAPEAAAAPSAEAAAPVAPPPEPPAALSPTDRALFQRVAAALATDPRGIWNEATPLFARYPRVYEVQDLRCKLALANSFAWDVTRDECAPLMKLSTSRPSEAR